MHDCGRKEEQSDEGRGEETERERERQRRVRYSAQRTVFSPTPSRPKVATHRRTTRTGATVTASASTPAPVPAPIAHLHCWANARIQSTRKRSGVKIVSGVSGHNCMRVPLTPRERQRLGWMGEGVRLSVYIAPAMCGLCPYDWLLGPESCETSGRRRADRRDKERSGSPLQRRSVSKARRWQKKVPTERGQRERERKRSKETGLQGHQHVAPATPFSARQKSSLCTHKACAGRAIEPISCGRGPHTKHRESR